MDTIYQYIKCEIVSFLILDLGFHCTLFPALNNEKAIVKIYFYTVGTKCLYI